MIVRLLILASILAAPARAALTSDELAKAGAHPPADAALPAGLRFTDVDGRREALGAVASGRPLVLVFADYTCRNVCAPGLALTGYALAQSGLRPGVDYRVAVIGLDPHDGAPDARAMAARMLTAPGVAQATHLLLGDPIATPAAARALGYTYVYDAANDQYAHDAAIYVFAADGRLRTLLPELGLRPAAVKDALTAAATPPPSLADRVAHLCYGFAAAHGRFARPVTRAMQALSLLLLLALGGFLWRRRRAA